MSIRDVPVPEARAWEPSIIQTESGKQLAIRVFTDDGSALEVHLSSQEGIDLARWLFVNALRLSAHTANGRLSAAISARLMIREVQDVQREVRDGRAGQ